MQKRPTFQELIRDGYQLQLPLPMPPGIRRDDHSPDSRNMVQTLVSSARAEDTRKG